ncbi:MAG: DinB family protein [Chloroflexi bacterium]|nr:DinB family protein [Chloroflexota bacterium]
MSKRNVLLKALAATPGDLERLVRGLEVTAATKHPSSDQRSIADVLCHFHMVEERYLARLELVVKEKRPHLPTIHPVLITSIHSP